MDQHDPGDAGDCVEVNSELSLAGACFFVTCLRRKSSVLSSSAVTS